MTTCPHCGCSIDGKSKPRSLDQLRRFFAMLRAMYQHWPEAASFQPHNEEHLRAWVLCKSGHGEITVSFTLPEMDPEILERVKGIIGRVLEDDRRFPRWKGNTLAAYEAKSISFSKLGQAEFNKLNDEVEAVYASETGLDPETVLKESESAA